ncbi:MAG: LLM class flavin-dependent oxidoreductase [bacterium]|nr:hypothetical protein [Deltaproteobacteria bacterium]MCP4903795.1 LLM class flavin-dependent oxidoreductase [bacterium]
MYDSAALYEDIWIHIARAAEATERIGIGTAVLVPNLRHVMTTAPAIATIDRIAPGRLVCAIETGYTARRVLRQNALTWKFMRAHIEQLRALLRGDVDGRACQMIHRPELAKARPIDVPILISAFGPKGRSIAREIADGWMGMTPPPEAFDWAEQWVRGTVLERGESPSASRVVDDVGAWLVGAYHLTGKSPRKTCLRFPVVPIGSRKSRPSERNESATSPSTTVIVPTCLQRTGRRSPHSETKSPGTVGWVKSRTCANARKNPPRRTRPRSLYTPAGDHLLRQAETFYRAVESVQG